MAVELLADRCGSSLNESLKLVDWPVWPHLFLIRRAGQLLFGTDFLMADQMVPQFELLESMKLPEEVQEKIYRGNAIRVLGLGKK